MPEKYNSREFRLKKIGSDAFCLIERLCGIVYEYECKSREIAKAVETKKALNARRLND